MADHTERAGYGIGKQNVIDALLKNTVAKINAHVEAQTHGAAPQAQNTAALEQAVHKQRCELYKRYATTDRDLDAYAAAVRAKTLKEVRKRLEQNEAAIERDGGEQQVRDVSDGLILAHRVLDALEEK